MSQTMTVPDGKACELIARRFLPSRWHYHYVRSKLATDPLFAGVAHALDGCNAPLLDLGCGVGLLAHYLDACGLPAVYLGVDNDPRKIAQARAVAARADFTNTSFELLDLADGGDNGGSEPVPAPVQSWHQHCGSVAILDVLQFLPPPAQAPLLRHAAACVAPGARLIIRTGLAGSSWRSRVTRSVDWLSRWVRWMNTGPKAYPERAALASLLHEAGLQASFTPLWAGTPFNNWLVVAERPDTPSGNTQR